VITDLSSLWFENARDGQRVRVMALPSQVEPGRFVLEYMYRPFTGEHAVPAHFHPASTETFEILAGQARYRVGREERSATVGQQIIMPAGVPHVHPWSNSAEPLHVRQTGVSDPPDPAGILASIQAQITLFGLAGAGKVNGAGLPNLLQLGVLGASTMPATFLAGPPVAVQRLLFSMLGLLGRWAGYCTAYPAYGIVTADGLEPPRPPPAH
jgi:quercetin dioxygenase-like cupin family protein